MLHPTLSDLLSACNLTDNETDLLGRSLRIRPHKDVQDRTNTWIADVPAKHNTARASQICASASNQAQAMIDEQLLKTWLLAVQL